MLYRVKLARPLSAERNRPDVIHKRYDYASWFMRHAVANHCVFIDAVTTYGLPEAKEEPEPERGPTDKYAGKEGVILPWHLPFLQPMASYSIQQLSVA